MNKRIVAFSGSVALAMAVGLIIQNSNETDSQPTEFVSNFVKEEKLHASNSNKTNTSKHTIASAKGATTNVKNVSTHNKLTTDLYQNFRKQDIGVADANEANKVLSELYIPSHRADESFEFNKAKYGTNGSTYYSFQQMYKGLKVYGAEIAVQVSKNQKLESIIGKYSTALSIDTTASLSGTDALESSLNNISNGDKTAQKVFKEPELIVYMDYDDAAHLAYESVVRYTDQAGMYHTNKIFTDANSGEVIDTVNRIHGERDIDIYTLNGNCTSMGSNSSLPGQLARDNDTATGTQSVDNAYDYLNNSYHFYKHMFNRNSFDANDATITATVDAQFRNGYQCSGLNAFFSPDDAQLAFGNGDNDTKNFAGAEDIVGHELTHAVTWKTSNLEYKNESGALNESISDIFGTAIQAWSLSGGGVNGNPANIETNNETWVLGEQLENTKFNRYLNDPTKDGNSPDNYDDRYTGTQDNGGVHSNSGITNLSFALLVEGGTHPQNETDVEVTGIGMDKAIRIWYEAQTTTIGTRTDFDNIRASLANAATSLYDECSPEYRAVQQSMDAVKMPGTWECVDPDTTPPEVSSITPADGATGVAISTSMKVTFNEPMDGDTITASNITLSDSNSVNIAGTVTMNGDIATFNPTSDLAYTSTYTLNVTTNVKDVAGNNLGSAQSVSFTTVDEPDNTDTTPPTVSSVSPNDSSTDVAKDTSVSAEFSEAVDTDSLSSAFSLATQDGENVSASVSVDGTTATLTPSSELLAGTTYIATISTDAKDISGNALENAKTWSFTTIAEQNGGSASLADATLSASSIYNMSYDVENIRDGNQATEWVSQTNYRGYFQVEWIRIDLASASDVGALSIDWNGYYFPREMNLWALVDGQQVLLGSVRKGSPGRTTFNIDRNSVTSLHLEMRGGRYGSWFVIKEVTLD